MEITQSDLRFVRACVCACVGVWKGEGVMLKIEVAILYIKNLISSAQARVSTPLSPPQEA